MNFMFLSKQEGKLLTIGAFQEMIDFEREINEITSIDQDG